MPFASTAWPSCTCIQPPNFIKQTHNTFAQEHAMEDNGHIICNSQSIKQCRQSSANMPASQAMQRPTQHTEQLASQRAKHTEKSEQHSTHTHTHTPTPQETQQHASSRAQQCKRHNSQPHKEPQHQQISMSSSKYKANTQKTLAEQASRANKTKQDSQHALCQQSLAQLHLHPSPQFKKKQHRILPVQDYAMGNQWKHRKQ